MTIYFNNSYICNQSIVAGPFLIDGPLKGNFDEEYKDFYDGEETFEDCEIKELNKCIKNIIKKEKDRKINVLLSSDLNNQIVISNLVAERVSIPYMGMYNACASYCEELIIGSALLNNKDIKNVLCTTSGHNMTSERTYRNPVEYGAPKPKYATFTVSAATCTLISSEKSIVKIDSGTIGKVIDLGVTDSNDMGSAMVPAAARTLFEHLKDTNRDENYYDLILTGDLGKYGKKIFRDYCKKEYGYVLDNYNDSATLIYNNKDERVLAGGSGPSCLPSYFLVDILPKMKSKKIKRVLLLATGALLSTTSVNQKKSIPCICHAVSLEVV
ncbi:MAG: stage V sporulation protein AD [Bacilli bacterium]|nr:stage V sporulation protein AD [Bacilli bacterium]